MLNQTKIKNNKEKEPKPDTGGHEIHFGKKVKRKGQGISTSDP
jgi:hypothetical protein